MTVVNSESLDNKTTPDISQLAGDARRLLCELVPGAALEVYRYTEEGVDCLNCSRLSEETKSTFDRAAHAIAEPEGNTDATSAEAPGELLAGLEGVPIQDNRETLGVIVAQFEGASVSVDPTEILTGIAELLAPALRRSVEEWVSFKAEFDATFEAIPLPALLTDSHDRIAAANEAFEAWTGQSISQLRGRTFGDITSRTDAPRVVSVTTPDSTEKFGRVTELDMESGRPVTLRTIRDITESHRDRRLRVQSEETLERFYEIVSNKDISLQSKLQNLVEFGRQRLGLQLGLLNKLNEDELEIVAVSGMEEILAPGMSMDREKTYCRRTLESDGLTMVVDAEEDPSWSDDPAYVAHGFEHYIGAEVVVDGESYGTFCFMGSSDEVDAPKESQRLLVKLLADWLGEELERDRQQHQLAESRQQLRNILDLFPHMLFVQDIEGRFVVANEAVAQYFGTLVEELEYCAPADLAEPSEELTQLFEVDETLFESNIDDSSQKIRVENPDGSTWYVEKRLASFQDPRLDDRALLSAIIDRTQSVRAQRTLERFFEVSVDYLCVLTPDFEPVQLSSAFAKNLGYEPEELFSDSLMSLTHKDDREPARRKIEDLLAGDSVVDFESRLRGKDGQYRKITWRAGPDPDTQYIYAAGRELDDE